MARHRGTSSPDADGTTPLQVMTGATIEETRTDALLGGSYYFDNGKASLTGGISNEKDYFAWNGGLSAERHFNEKNTTVSAGGGFSIDTLEPTDAAGDPFRPNEANKESYSLFAGVSQVLGRGATIQSTLSYQHATGYLSDPYKRVLVEGNPIGDSRPSARNQFAWLTRYRQHVEFLNGSFHADYRFFIDDWEITSHTIDVAWYQNLFGFLRVVPGLRYYTQSAAGFYAPWFVTAPGDGFASSDFPPLSLRRAVLSRPGRDPLHDVAARLARGDRLRALRQQRRPGARERRHREPGPRLLQCHLDQLHHAILSPCSPPRFASRPWAVRASSGSTPHRGETFTRRCGPRATKSFASSANTRATATTAPPPRSTEARGDRRGIEVDPETAALLDYAQTAWEESDGLFDPTSGVLRRVWDFRSGKLPSPESVAKTLQDVGWQRLDWRGRRLRLPRAGMQLDFGGFVKEYAADRVAQLLREAGHAHGLVDLGGDLATVGPHPDATPWRVGVRDPFGSGGAVTAVALHHGGIATSGDYERGMRVDGKRYGHILDPRTGWPVESWLSVSVTAAQCLIAGTASTVAMLQASEGEAFLDDLALPYLLVDAEGDARGPLAQRTAREPKRAKGSPCRANRSAASEPPRRNATSGAWAPTSKRYGA